MARLCSILSASPVSDSPWDTMGGTPSRAAPPSETRMRRDPKTKLSSEELQRALTEMERAFLAVDCAGTISFANVRAAALLESTPEALVGSSVDEVLMPLEQLAAAHLREDASGEWVRRRNDGEERTLAFTVSSVAKADDPACIAQVIVFRDITDIAQLREQRDKLLRMATVGELMPTLLHEIRNPIAAITASLELAIEDGAENVSAEFLHAVLSEARRITVSLQGLGASAGSLHSAEPAAIDHAVREACRLLQAKAEKRGVTLAPLVPDLPLLPVDAGTLRAILLNLLNNALDACTRGDSVFVAANLRAAGSEFELRVEDTGSGMSREVYEQCTNLFFTTKRSGSGIGLALSRRLVEEAGGELEVSSLPGVGTSVRIRLPLDVVAANAVPRRAATLSTDPPLRGVSWMPPRDETQARSALPPRDETPLRSPLGPQRKG